MKTMNIETRIINITQRMLQIRQESILDKFESILEEEEIVARTLDGVSLTKHSYKSNVLEAKESVLKGDYITQDDLKLEFKEW